MVAPNGLLYVGRNSLHILYGADEMEGKSASLSVINSTFESIEYGHVLLEVNEQTLGIYDCQFQDIRLWTLATQCDDLGSLWCQTFFFCRYSSTCRLEDLCLEDFEYASEGYLMAIDPSSEAFFSGTSYRSGINRFAPAVGGASDVCSSGVVQIEMRGLYPDPGADFYPRPVACIDPEEIDRNWTATATCPIP